MASRITSRISRLSHHVPRLFSTSYCRLYSTRTSKPLRILYCGSDEFSIASLRAVHDYQLSNPEAVASIDVLIRPAKPSGRGRKTLKESPIKAVAQNLGLRLYERDTFTGWDLPKVDNEPINLLIAVSFGLLVPPRILNSCEYGGLNIHPSILPDFRGPAPLTHALLRSCTHTGITLQSLHPSKFDHGALLLQTPLPGLPIPSPQTTTPAELEAHLAPLAGEMLVRGLKDKVYLPGYPALKPQNVQLRHAEKITPRHRELRFGAQGMSADEMARRERVLGRCWSVAVVPRRDDGAGDAEGGAQKRVVLHGLKPVAMPAAMRELYSTHEDAGDLFKPVTFVRSRADGDARGEEKITLPMMKSDDGRGVIVPTRGGAVEIGEATMDGRKRAPAAMVLYGRDKSVEEKGEQRDLAEDIFWGACIDGWGDLVRP